MRATQATIGRNRRRVTEPTLIIIPHYGSDDLLRELLGSADFALPPLATESDWVFTEQGGFSFLIVNNNRTNRGFTAACNLGLTKLPASQFKFAWLLNNDTAFESRRQFEKALAEMQVLARERNWAIVAQQVLNYFDRDQIVFGGGLECFPSGRHKSGSRSVGDFSLPSEERWLSFCSVLISRGIVESIGAMDESLVNYYSDSDYSLTARKSGFTIGYAGEESYVFHKLGQSSRPCEEQQRVLHNDYRTFWRKWIAGSEHQVYLRLMRIAGGDLKSSGHSTAGSLREGAAADGELRVWLNSLPEDQPIQLLDIVQHFQHQSPISDLSTLCNITREMMERR